VARRQMRAAGGGERAAGGGGWAANGRPRTALGRMSTILCFDGRQWRAGDRVGRGRWPSVVVGTGGPREWWPAVTLGSHGRHRPSGADGLAASHEASVDGARLEQQCPEEAPVALLSAGWRRPALGSGLCGSAAEGLGGRCAAGGVASGGGAGGGHSSRPAAAREHGGGGAGYARCQRRVRGLRSEERGRAT
jgi:hypothetical protein